MVTGILYFGQNWCIHMKGPVFAAAFSPLLVVFSFLFEIIFFQTKMNIKRSLWHQLNFLCTKFSFPVTI